MSADFSSSASEAVPGIGSFTESYGLVHAPYPISPATTSALDLAIQQSIYTLSEFFSRSEFPDQLVSLFGRAGTDSIALAERIKGLEENLREADLLTGIQLLQGGDMSGALGAFTSEGPSGATPQIYLNAEWVASSSADAITGVILEEMGHAIDFFLNHDLDSPGDEGELFSAVARGLEIPDTTRAFIHAEDDQIHLSISGSSWLAEAALTTASSTTGTRVNSFTNPSKMNANGQTIIFDAITIGSPSGSVLLNVNAYDVDWTGRNSGTREQRGEWDAVYLSGGSLPSRTLIGYLNGYDGVWSWSTFDVTSHVTGSGNYTVEIEPSVSPSINTPNSWVVSSRYASLTYGTTNGFITDLSIDSSGKVTSTLQVDTNGTYGLSYYLINPSNNVVVSTYSESNNLTAHTPFLNQNDQLTAWPVTNGTYTLRAVLTDSAGSTIRDIDTWTVIANGGTPSVDSDSNPDSTAPSVAITSSDNNLKVGDTSVVTFRFSEDVKDFSLADVTALNGTFGSLSSKVNNGDGTFSYSATFTPTANVEDATNQFSVGTNWTDIAGNAPSGSTSSANYAIDTKRPTVSINSTDNALKVGDTTTVTFTFSEDIQNFDLTDVTAPNGTFGSLSSKVNNGDGTFSYSATFTPTANIEDATNQFSIGTSWTDIAGNAPAGITTSSNYSIDTIRPEIAITGDRASMHNGQTALITFTLTEASTTFNQGDVNVTGGKLSQWEQVSASVYTAVFMPTNNSNLNGSISVASDRFTDSAGNTNKDGSDADNTLLITVAPTAIIRSSSSSVQPGSLNKVLISLTEGSTTFSQSAISSNVQLRNFRKINDALYQVEYVAPRSGKVTLSVRAGSYTDLGGVASIAHSENLDRVSIDVLKQSSYGAVAPITRGRGGTTGIVVGRARALPGMRRAAGVSTTRRPQPVGRSASTGIFHRWR